jgi:glucose-1-phosphate thymidylyltransferase
MNEDLKRLCMERDAFRCRHCGTTEQLTVLNTSLKNNYNLSNLFTLCESCAEETKTPKDKNRVGVLLCGGKGTRLYPMTRLINKHLLPTGILPTVFYPLKTLRALGVSRVLVVVDRESGAPMMELLGSGAEFGLDISYKVQEGAGGIADALYLARDFVNGSNEIFCILGDNIFDNATIKNTSPGFMVRFFEINNHACVWLKEVENPVAYGVATIENGRVSKIVEKPANPETNLAVVGLYAYTSEVFDVIEQMEPSERGELEISAINNYFAQQGTLTYEKVEGYWGDMGGSASGYAKCFIHGASKANVSAQEIDNFRSIVFGDK